jgi:NADH dehydrogenase
VRRLLAGGYRVRAMTRSQERGQELGRQGAEVVIGDLIDRDSIARACQDVDRVFVAAHSALGRGSYRSEAVDDQGHRALINAARAAGVGRFVYTSALGAAPDHPVDFFRTKYAIEQHLRGSGLDYAILRPSAFMEWHAHAFNGKSLLDRGRTMLLGSGNKLRNFVSARDVAQFAILALFAAPLRERMVEIGGPGNFSNNEVAQLYARTAGIEPKIGHIPAAATRVIGMIARPLHPGLSRVMQLASLPDDAWPETFDPAGLLRDYPIPLTSLETFVRERVAERRAAAPLSPLE